MTPVFWVVAGPDHHDQHRAERRQRRRDRAGKPLAAAAASRSRPSLFGSVGAIVLRVVLTFFAVYLLTLPFLKLAGAALLLWIGVDLLCRTTRKADLDAHSNLWAAIKTIIVADFVMSLDNVIGVAAAAKGNVVLLVLGLGHQHPAHHLRQHADPQADEHAFRSSSRSAAVCSAGWLARWPLPIRRWRRGWTHTPMPCTPSPRPPAP